VYARTVISLFAAFLRMLREYHPFPSRGRGRIEIGVPPPLAGEENQEGHEQ